MSLIYRNVSCCHSCDLPGTAGGGGGGGQELHKKLVPVPSLCVVLRCTVWRCAVPCCALRCYVVNTYAAFCQQVVVGEPRGRVHLECRRRGVLERPRGNGPLARVRLGTSRDGACRRLCRINGSTSGNTATALLDISFSFSPTHGFY